MKVRRKNKTQPAALSDRNNSAFYVFGVVAALLYLAFVTYGPALRGPFVYDDFNLPFYNPLFRTENFMLWVGSVRPLLMLSYWLNFQLSGREPYSYHLVNLLLHLANTGAVYLITRKILTKASLDQPIRETLAVIASAIFLLHPLQTE